MSIRSAVPKIVVVLGPTASGKSALAVVIAEKYNGEVISADSRQVYRGMHIGTAKITRREMRGVPHHLLDVASPKKQFSAAQFQKLGQRALRDILRRGKLPIICGGTGHYIAALLDKQTLPNVPPDASLRKELEKLSTEELFAKLQKLDQRRAADIDRHNPRRLIRAIEIVTKTGRPVPVANSLEFGDKNSISYSNVLKNIGIGNVRVLKIGLRVPEKELKKRLHTRLLQWFRRGLISEVKKLKRTGVSSKRLAEFGLVYRSVDRYLKSAVSKDEMLDEIDHDLRHYVKRQLTWWKRDKNIRWVKNERAVFAAVKKFLQ